MAVGWSEQDLIIQKTRILDANERTDDVRQLERDLEFERASADIDADHIDRLEKSNRAGREYIKALEKNIASLERENKFLKVRDAALLAEVRALLEEIKKCPDEDHVHELHCVDESGRTKIEDVYDEAFLAEANKLGLPDPARYL